MKLYLDISINPLQQTRTQREMQTLSAIKDSIGEFVELNDDEAAHL